MTNEHNSLKTLFQNTGIVKSINRGMINGAVPFSGFYNTRYKHEIGSFKNTINPDKSILIMNFGDLRGVRETSSSLTGTILDFEITSTKLSFYTNDNTNDVEFMFYWQVIEFY